MSGQLLSTRALALDRQPSGESWLRITAFSASHGLLDCLQRLARRSLGKMPPIDLFDDVHLSLESRNQGRTWFVAEASLAARHAGIAASYPALQAACRLSRLIARNPVPDDSRPAVFALLARAFAAWAAGARPDLVYFKSIYLLARDEGYPVRQAWLQPLPPEDRACAGDVVRLPIAEQTVCAADVARLVASLETFLHDHAEFRFA